MSTDRVTEFDLEIEHRSRLLDEWVQTRAEIARLEARAADLLIERIAVHDADVAEAPFHRDAIYRSMTSEYAAAGRISKGSIEFAFGDAAALRDSFPELRRAFREGLVSAAHVREICREGSVVAEAVRNGKTDAETLGLYETAALVIAEQDTPARTRAHVRQVAGALVGETVEERHRRAHHERAVSVRSVGDGLALLSAILPEYLAVAIHDRLTQLARVVTAARDGRRPAADVDDMNDDDGGGAPTLPEHFELDDPVFDLESFAAPAVLPDAIFGDSDTFTIDPSPTVEAVAADTRSIDEVRADLLADLLLASDPSDVHGTALDGIAARVQVTISAETLAGADDRLAELDGHGPLHPDVARDLAGRATGWARLFLDATGMVTETDNYTPTAAMRRHLRARDQHCRFPGCRMPAYVCDIDHNHDHAKGGRTSLGNLSHFCRAHHALKHPDVAARHRWTARALPDGSIGWTSPLGRTYSDPPPRRVMFV